MNIQINKIFKFIFSTLLILNSGCEMKRDALGADNEIRVICSKIDQSDIEKFLQMVFSDTLFTPEPEPFYFLKFTRPESYDQLKTQSQVIVAAINREQTNPGYLLMKKILNNEQFLETQSNDPIVLGKNIHAKKQLFMVINAGSLEHLFKFVEKKRNYIRKNFDNQFKERQDSFLFNNGNHNEISDSLKSQFGWSLDLPWGWDFIKKTPDSNFVWLGREMPYQWIGIGWNKGMIPDDELKVGNYLWNWPLKYYKNVQFNNYKFELKKTKYNEYPAWRATGIWETTDIMEAKGGPFRSYVFYDSKKDITYHLNYLIHYPGKNKTIFFRQADLILKSFK